MYLLFNYNSGILLPWCTAYTRALDTGCVNYKPDSMKPDNYTPFPGTLKTPVLCINIIHTKIFEQTDVHLVSDKITPSIFNPDTRKCEY